VSEPILIIQKALQDRTLKYTKHALLRRIEREIIHSEIEEVIMTGEQIEDYPKDKYGPSCLISGRTAKHRWLHVQCSYFPRVMVITVYEPSLTEWLKDRKTRRKMS